MFQADSPISLFQYSLVYRSGSEFVKKRTADEGTAQAKVNAKPIRSIVVFKRLKLVENGARSTSRT